MHKFEQSGFEDTISGLTFDSNRPSTKLMNPVQDQRSSVLLQKSTRDLTDIKDIRRVKSGLRQANKEIKIQPIKVDISETETPANDPIGSQSN